MDTEHIAAILHCATRNDINGNPRRLWIGLDAQGHVIRCADEGYDGRPAWASASRSGNPDTPWDFYVGVTIDWYKLALKSWGHLG